MVDDAATIELLLLNRAIEPLSRDDQEKLLDIERLKIDDYKEEDVRADIIEPLVRILGYRKGHRFSLDREKEIKFLCTNKFIDFSLTLWERDIAACMRWMSGYPGQEPEIS